MKSFAAIREPRAERDQILQLLGGLGANYNSIVASLTTHEDDISLHLIRSMLRTYEQRLHLQNTIAENINISTNVAISQKWIYNNRKNYNNQGATTITIDHNANSVGNLGILTLLAIIVLTSISRFSCFNQRQQYYFN